MLTLKSENIVNYLQGTVKVRFTHNGKYSKYKPLESFEPGALDKHEVLILKQGILKNRGVSYVTLKAR